MTKEELLNYKNLLTDPYIKSGYTCYEITFKSLDELYDYLTIETPHNKEIFPVLSKQIDDLVLYEMSLEEALNYLHGGYKTDIEKLIEQKSRLERGLEFPGTKRQMTYGVTGSRISPNRFVVNDPKRYYKLERVNERKFMKIYINLGYSHKCTPNQILNRGALLYNIVKILEENNYSVELKTFFLMKEAGEITNIKVNLKNINSPLTVKGSIFPLTSRAFFRRIIFRVIESLPLEEFMWGQLYGRTLDAKFTKDFLGITGDDIYVGTPNEVGIQGYDIYDDAKKFLKYIEMDKFVRVKIKQ